ncbi:MAG TPA: hypothetical protein VFY45_21330 [Baekduia sp.]|nr:hypothetical protein [Baekduia sp.]
MSADDKLSPEIIRVAIVVIVGGIMSITRHHDRQRALESRSHDLGTPLSTIQWVASGHLLALATSSRSRAGRPSASGCAAYG